MRCPDLAFRSLVVLAAIVAATVACQPAEPAHEAPAEPSAPPIAIIQDGELDAALAEHRGQGMLLNFWAIWCEPCVAELPELVEVAHAYDDRGGSVVGLSFDLMVAGSDPHTIEDTMREFTAEHGVDIPVLIYDHDDYEALNERFTLPGGIPFTIAFDGNGNVVDRQDGKAGRERFEEMMRKALGL